MDVELIREIYFDLFDRGYDPIVIGSSAVILHGLNVPTDDIDIVVSKPLSVSNGKASGSTFGSINARGIRFRDRGVNVDVSWGPIYDFYRERSEEVEGVTVVSKESAVSMKFAKSLVSGTDMSGDSIVRAAVSAAVAAKLFEKYRVIDDEFFHDANACDILEVRRCWKQVPGVAGGRIIANILGWMGYGTYDMLIDIIVLRLSEGCGLEV